MRVEIAMSEVRKPPQSLEAERAVLCAMLLDARAVAKAMRILTPESFYLQAHRRVFEAIARLSGKGQPADIVTVGAELVAVQELEVVGGHPFLSSLLDDTMSAGNVEEHAQLVAGTAARRALIVAASEVATSAYDDRVSAEDALNGAVARLVDVMMGSMRQESHERRIRDIMADHSLVLAERAKARNGVTGIPTGFAPLDTETCGMQPGELWMVGADSSVGKTIVVEQMCVSAAKAGFPALFFSMEMDSMTIADRLTARETGIEHWRVRRAQLSKEMLATHEGLKREQYDLPYWIDDTTGLSVAQIQTRARLAVMQHGIRMIAIDYLLLIDMECEMEHATEEMAIRRSLVALHNLARSLKVPVVIIQQLKRDRELAPKAAGKWGRAPTVRDLKGSQSCEAESNVVLLIWRPEMQQCVKEQRSMDVTRFIIGKQRNGRVCQLKMLFDCDHVRFETAAGGGEGPSVDITDGGELREYDDIPG